MPIVELQQDRALINTQFDCYMLSLDTVPILNEELKCAPRKIQPRSEQFSSKHSEMFIRHNFLVNDPWARTLSYFVNIKCQLLCAHYEPSEGRAKPLQTVYTFQSKRMTNEAYNYSMRFISECICVFCDGKETLYLLNTGDRLKCTEWKLMAELNLTNETAVTPAGTGYLLIDARLDIMQEQKQISLALAQIVCDERTETNVTRYLWHVCWSKWLQKSDGWCYEICDAIETKGTIYYCAFEPRGESLIICSDNELSNQAQRAERQLENGKEEKASKKEDMTENPEKTATQGEISKDQASTNNCSMQFMESIPDLDAALEECDFMNASSDNVDVTLQRFHLPSKEVTHKVIFGSTPPLFSTVLRPGFPPALVTRQGVDASLWLQHYFPNKPDEWTMRHEGNLHAFAYVQASKTEKKFMDCSPDLSYAIISESLRHIFIYRAKYDTATNLRNRRCNQTTIGKQQLVTLKPEYGEIVGLCTAPEVVTLLTEKAILYLQML